MHASLQFLMHPADTSRGWADRAMEPTVLNLAAEKSVAGARKDRRLRAVYRR
jgi:hypothetical protein